MVLCEHTFVEDALLLVTGESAELPQQHRRERRRLLLGGCDHADKVRALLCFATTDAVITEDELIRHDIAVLFGIFADLLDLTVGGELRLIVGADADVSRGGFQFNIHTNLKKGIKIPL